MPPADFYHLVFLVYDTARNDVMKAFKCRILNIGLKYSPLKSNICKSDLHFA